MVVSAYALPHNLAERGAPAHPDDFTDHDCVNIKAVADNAPGIRDQL